jgi:hypothetical protein
MIILQAFARIPFAIYALASIQHLFV